MHVRLPSHKKSTACLLRIPAILSGLWISFFELQQWGGAVPTVPAVQPYAYAEQ